MTTTPRVRWFLALLAALATAGCGKTENDDYPSPPPADPSVRSPAAPMTVSHVLIAYKGAERATATRSKESALIRAEGILSEAKSGRRSFEAIVEEFTDDRGGQGGKPSSGNMIDRNDRTSFPPGTYVFNEVSGFAPPFTEASKKAKPGEIVLVETTFGYHVIKRVK